MRVKLLRPEFALQSGVVEKFLKGPRFLSAMTHSSLPSVRIDTDDTGIPFVVEEVVDGRELSSLIDGFPQGLPLPLVAKVIVPLVEVLALAHESGVVHGAIDVQRVKLLGPAHEPSPKLLDFGVPASERTPAEDAYRAPELSSSDAGSEQGDVFAMGVLLYVMLSGTLPFRSGKKSAMPLDEVAPQVPQEWVELTTACLEPQTTKRLADASVLLKKLRHCAGERSSVSRVKAIDQTADASFEDTAPEEEPKESKSAKEVKSAKEAHDVKVSMAATMLAMPAPVVSAPATPDEKETVADPVTAKPEAKHEPKAEAKADAKADAKAEPPVISSLANVFGSAEESEKKDKKSAAKEAADKLKSKAKHHDRDSHVEARDKEHEHKHDPKHDHKHDPKHDKDKPRESKVTVRHGDRESKVDSERPAPAKHEPGKRATPPAGSPRPKTAGPTQGQIAAVALTDAQLNALRGMRTKNTEERDRWVGLIFLLLFMLMLQLGIPLLYEPHMTRAHVLFGPRLNIVAGAFSMVTIVATARMWFAQVQARSPIDRVTSFTLQVV
ncbi:MAG TPA: hypothetical protein VHM19_11935, partial [Polyangiales bacterium]|nr:hypothetical protein [Polyangiales bacterium]